ncbi:MAG: Crp/Fnr family transcriptional regulator [Prevotella sp.]
MDDEILKTLELCPLFRGMTADHIEQLLNEISYKIVHFEKKDIYALAGYPCKYADIILKGEMVARMVGLSGKYVEVSRLKPSGLIAPAFIFAQENQMPVSVETDVETDILRMSSAELNRLINTNEIIRTNYIRLMADIQVFLTRKLRILSLLTVREKVAYMILTFSKKQNSNTILLDKSRQEIADSFGIQKFSLLRCLSELVDTGAISVKGKNITILDRRKLE